MKVWNHEIHTAVHSRCMIMLVTCFVKYIHVYIHVHLYVHVHVHVFYIIAPFLFYSSKAVETIIFRSLRGQRYIHVHVHCTLYMYSDLYMFM